MEKAIVMGCACVVISGLTPEEIDRFRRYDPEALTLKRDGETVYTVEIDREGPGSLEEDKAVYSAVKSANGKATITILLDPGAEDKAKLVQDRLGAPLLKLKELEEQILGRKDQLRETEKSVDELITRL